MGRNEDPAGCPPNIRAQQSKARVLVSTPGILSSPQTPKIPCSSLMFLRPARPVLPLLILK